MEKPNSLNSLISPEAFVTLSFWKRVAEQNQLKFIVHLSLIELIEQLLESQTGCWYTYPLKNMTSSVGMMTFPIYGRKTKLFQNTSQIN